MPTPESDTGVSTVLATATRTLRSAGVGSPRVDAELLLAHVLLVGRGRLLLAPALAAAAAGPVRRTAHAPGGRGAGAAPDRSAPFRHLDLAVGPGCSSRARRPNCSSSWPPPTWPAPRTAVDLCAGSGAVALAVADEYPAGRVFAVERSAGALVWLRRNAAERAAAGDPPVDGGRRRRARPRAAGRATPAGSTWCWPTRPTCRRSADELSREVAPRSGRRGVRRRRTAWR